MKKVISLTGIAALAAATIFVWSQLAVSSSREVGATVGVSHRAQPAQEEASISSPELLLRRAGPLPIEGWDAH